MATSILTGIYQISFGEYLYVGQSRSIHRRINKHLRELKRGIHTNLKMQNVYLKHSNLWKFDILELCSSNCTNEYLNIREQFYIDQNILRGKWCLNICLIANRPPGMKGRKLTDEHKRKIGAANLGKTLSTESRQKIAKARSGKPLSKEHKLKLSQNAARPNLGKHLSKEICAKVSENHADVSGKLNPSYGKPSVRRREVISIDPNTNSIVMRYLSINHAAADLQIGAGGICNVCKGRRKLAGGLKWEYAE